MAIFNTNRNTDVVKYNVSPTLEGAAFAVMEANESASNLVSALYASDVIIENKVLTEGANAEVLVEATIKELFGRFIESLKKLKDKIVNWFKKLWANIKIRMTSNKKFVEKYRKEIQKVGKKNARINGIPYDTQKVVDAFISVTAYANKLSVDTIDKDTKDDFLGKVQDILRAPGRTVADFKTAAVKMAKGGGNGKKEEILVNDAFVAAALKDIDGMKDVLEKINNVEKEAKKVFDSLISKVNAASNKVKEGQHAQMVITTVNTMSGVVSAIAAVAAKMVEAHSRQNISMLKAALLKRKESAEIAEDMIDAEGTDIDGEDAPIEELVEQDMSLEVINEDDTDAPLVDEDVEVQIEEAKEDEVVTTDVENDPDSVLAEALSMIRL